MKEIFESQNTKLAVLFSMGSSVDTKQMPNTMKKAFLDAFSRFPDIEFIWKFSRNESDSLENELFASAQNVHPFEWIDQKTILGLLNTIIKTTFSKFNQITIN